MGTSFTEYNGYGFWARDGQIEEMLRLLVGKIDQEPKVTAPWLEMRADFDLQSQGWFNGFVSPGLDRHVTDVTRDRLVALSREVLGELEANEAPDAWLVDYARKWIALITGDFELQEVAYIGDIHAVGAHPKLRDRG